MLRKIILKWQKKIMFTYFLMMESNFFWSYWNSFKEKLEVNVNNAIKEGWSELFDYWPNFNTILSSQLGRILKNNRLWSKALR